MEMQVVARAQHQLVILSIELPGINGGVETELTSWGSLFLSVCLPLLSLQMVRALTHNSADVTITQSPFRILYPNFQSFVHYHCGLKLLLFPCEVAADRFLPYPEDIRYVHLEAFR